LKKVFKINGYLNSSTNKIHASLLDKILWTSRGVTLSASRSRPGGEGQSRARHQADPGRPALHAHQRDALVRAGSDIAFLGGIINYVINNERWTNDPFFKS
jgi:hypothetical protein